MAAPRKYPEELRERAIRMTPDAPPASRPVRVPGSKGDAVFKGGPTLTAPTTILNCLSSASRSRGRVVTSEESFSGDLLD